MKTLLYALAFLVALCVGHVASASCPAINPNILAPPFVDGCSVLAQGLNRLLPLSLPTPGFFEQLTYPTPSFTSWLNTPMIGTKNAYGYLGVSGQLVVPTNYGEPAIVGASRTSNTPLPNVCCSIGLAGVGVNDNTTTPETAFPLYVTGARLAGTGATLVEFDIANVDSATSDINAYIGPFNTVPGSTVDLVLQSGGEPGPLPFGVGSTPLTDTSAALYIGPNGSYFRHGIVIVENAFNPTNPCSTAHNCPAIEMGQGQEIRWPQGGPDIPGTFLRSNNTVAGQGNGIEFTQFGANFENVTGQIEAAVANAEVLANTGFVILGSLNGDARVGVGTANGCTNCNLDLTAAGTGAVVAGAPFRPQITTIAILGTTCNTAGYEYVVTDAASSPVYNAIVTGSGGTVIPVYCDGVNWRNH